MDVEYKIFQNAAEKISRIENNKYGAYCKEIGKNRTMINQSFPLTHINKVIDPYEEEDFLNHIDEIETWFMKFLNFCVISVIPRNSNVKLTNELYARDYKLIGYMSYWIKMIENMKPTELALEDDYIKEVTEKNTLDDFISVATKAFGFEENSELALNFEEQTRLTFEYENVRNYVYYNNQTPVGTGSVIFTDDVAFLGNASVLEEYRGHKIQQKMIHHRINKALECNCKYVFTTTGINTTSGRNMERLDFKSLAIVNLFGKKFSKA